ncbi:MAG: hypothetical protein ABI321_06675 [Polyangia bacterium]
MSLHPSELSFVPSLRGSWVAIDTHPRALSRGADPLHVALRSGAIVVDADEELDQLCRRIKADRRTALTIVYAA